MNNRPSEGVSRWAEAALKDIEGLEDFVAWVLLDLFNYWQSAPFSEWPAIQGRIIQMRILSSMIESAAGHRLQKSELLVNGRTHAN